MAVQADGTVLRLMGAKTKVPRGPYCATLNRGGWLGCRRGWLTSEARDHMRRFLRLCRLKRPDIAELSDEAADVANFLMMSVDKRRKDSWS